MEGARRRGGRVLERRGLSHRGARAADVRDDGAAELRGRCCAASATAVEQLRELEAKVTTVDPSLGGDELFRDPERLAEAAAFVEQRARRRRAAAGPQAGVRASRVRGERVEPAGGARRGRGHRRAGPALQPAVHHGPERRRARRTCSTRSATSSRAAATARRAWRCVGAQLFIDELIAALQEGTIERLARALPRGRRAAHRRRAVRRRQGAHAGRAVPRLQRTSTPTGKQLVFASDVPPKAIDGLEERLRSRFEGGLVVEMQAPDRALREKLYARYPQRRRRRRRRGELLAYLAERPVSSVREMIGIVHRLLAPARSRGRAAHARHRRARSSSRRCGRARRRAATCARRPTSFFLDDEKIVWGWPDVAGRLDRGAALMAIKGSLKEASLPDVLQLLAMGKKTGCLSRHAPQQLRLHLLRQGAHLLRVDREPARPARRHARQGRARSRRRSSTRRSPRRTTQRDKRLGELLVAQGAITRDAAARRTSACRSRRRSTSCSRGRRGRSTSRRDVAPEEQDFLVSINPESLLLEGARRVDEWSLIEKKIPSFDLVFDVDREQARGERGRADARAGDRRSSCIDGTRDVAGGHRRVGARRVRRRQGALRARHRGLPAPRRAARSAAEPAVTRLARRRAPQPRRRVLQDRDARRGDARVPPRRRAARATTRRRASTSASRCRGRASGRTRCTAFTRVRGAAGRARVGASTTSRTRSSGSGRYDEARPALDEAVRRGGAKDPRIQTSVGVRRAARRRRRGRRRGAAGGAAAVRHAAADGGVVPLRGAHRRAARRRSIARSRSCRRASPRIRTRRRCYNNLAAVHERRG